MAVTLTTAALTFAPAAVAKVPPANGFACMGAPHYSYTVNSFIGLRTAHLEVTFPSTCDQWVRAFYAHPSATGTVVEYGRTVRGTSVSSSVLSRDASYCRFGWEARERHRWHAITLRSRGGC